MFLSEIKRKILLELIHEPLNLFPLAAQMDEAPFRIRAELKDLKRLRLVREQIGPTDHLWTLTDRGERHAHGLNQTEIFSPYWSYR